MLNTLQRFITWLEYRIIVFLITSVIMGIIFSKGKKHDAISNIELALTQMENLLKWKCLDNR